MQDKFISTTSLKSNDDKAPESVIAKEQEIGPFSEMADYGISRVSVDYFHFKNFRYTTLKDAIDQAKWMNTHGAPKENRN